MTRGGMSPNRSFVVMGCPNLCDFRLPPVQPQLKLGFKHLVVYVGVMGQQDGLDLLLDSVEYLVNKIYRHDTLFVLIGGGTELSRLKGRASGSGLDPWVKFTGPLYGDDLLVYLATADIGVAPDPSNPFNDKLTMLKILEYMASGLPIVLYDLVEGRSAARDAALYAKANDPVDFAERIVTLLDSQTLRGRLGASGTERIRRRLNWANESQTLLKAYETALFGVSLGGNELMESARMRPYIILWSPIRVMSLPRAVDWDKRTTPTLPRAAFTVHSPGFFQGFCKRQHEATIQARQRRNREGLAASQLS
jgi:hypothetical protein